ncbi:MAG: NRDE family protein [Bacteroidia bacterium]
MCTVTFIPINKNSFVLTQNRDEHYSRPSALLPEIYEVNGKKLLFPKDTTGGGTWIATSYERITCLLNGAFKPHIFMPPYRKSRGLIVLDSFGFDSMEDFSKQYDFENIEPFTMIVVDFNDEQQLAEIRWDGRKIFFKELSSDNYHIWSSASLYDDEMHQLRVKWFDEWLKNKIKKLPEDILRFHHEAGDGDLRTNVLMNRGNIISTVSISSIFVEDGEVVFSYEDVKNHQQKKISFNKEVNKHQL